MTLSGGSLPSPHTYRLPQANIACLGKGTYHTRPRRVYHCAPMPRITAPRHAYPRMEENCHA